MLTYLLMVAYTSAQLFQINVISPPSLSNLAIQFQPGRFGHFKPENKIIGNISLALGDGCSPLQNMN